jgi:hypothetical protein
VHAQGGRGTCQNSSDGMVHGGVSEISAWRLLFLLVTARRRCFHFRDCTLTRGNFADFPFFSFFLFQSFPIFPIFFSAAVCPFACCFIAYFLIADIFQLRLLSRRLLFLVSSNFANLLDVCCF